MKILINASNLVVGGGVQKAVQFVRSACRWGGEHRWHAVLSPLVAEGLGDLQTPDHVHIETAGPSPARLLAGRPTRDHLRSVEASFAPDVVFSVSGPCYHDFGRPHVMGFAVGWLTHPSDLAWQSLPSVRERFLFRLRLAWYAHWVRGRADAWLLQTDTAARGMVAHLGARDHQVHVVPNSCSDFYFEARDQGTEPLAALGPCPEDEERWLVFTSYKPHKDLEIVPPTAAALRRRGTKRPVRFVFTLDPQGTPWQRLLVSARDLGVEDLMTTVGGVPAYLGPSLYQACSGLFMPTLLETFSASYPEAMCMDRPVVASDLDFARDICGEAAAWFMPRDAEAAAAAILSVVEDPDRRRALLDTGRRQLEVFGSGEDRFGATLTVITGLADS